MDNNHLQILPPVFGKSNFKRLVVFCNKYELGDQGIRRKMIGSRRVSLKLIETEHKDIIYKTPVTSLDEMKLRIVAAIETVTPQTLKNTWRETEHHLYILPAMKGAHVKII